MIDFWHRKLLLLFGVTITQATLIYHQEVPDLWRHKDIEELQNTCVVGNCQSSVGNSFVNFNSVATDGPHCFLFEWDDSSMFSWCQLKNPLEHKDISETAFDVYYTSKAVTTFESGDKVRFSGLFFSKLSDSLFDGNRGGNHQWGVAIAKLVKGGFQRALTLNAPGEDSVCSSINLYYQQTPFEPHGYSCQGSGVKTFTEVNPVFTCEGGKWDEWSIWSTCTASCGGTGTKSRNRECDDEIPCVGSTSESRVCNTQMCPLKPHAFDPCTCDDDLWECHSSSHPHLKCTPGTQCEKISMDPNEQWHRCIPNTMGECKATGDPHLYTFDHVQHDIYSVNKYVMTQVSENADVPKFKVIMETSPYGTVSIAERAFLTFGSPDGNTLYTVTTDRAGAATITIDGQTRDLFDQDNDSFTFRRFPGRIKLVTWFGLVLHHQDWTIRVQVPMVFQSHLEGLCGNYNMDKNDDFKEPDGTVMKCGIDHDNGYKLSDCERDSACGWKTENKGEDCGPDPEDIDFDCNKADECEKIFNSRWLKDCNDVVDPTESIADCTIDLCLAEKGTEEDVKRQLLGDYMEKCKTKIPENPVVCSWTSNAGFGSGCGENQVYNACAKPCADSSSCDAKACPESEETLGLCVCAPGFNLSHGKCVEECPDDVGELSEWSHWGVCYTGTAVCGTGSQRRSRVCLGPPGTCDPNAETKATRTCEKPCGKLTNWSEWGSCGLPDGKLCGPGSQTRSRECEGGPCTGDWLENKTCEVQCSGDFGPWADWQGCSVSCGGGVKHRERPCNFDKCPRNMDGSREEKVCNVHSCPIDPVNLPECTCGKNEWTCHSEDCDMNTERCELIDVNSNTFKCKPKAMGECRAHGDPHIVTFDQQTVDIYGVGEYVFSECDVAALPNYSVIMTTSPWKERWSVAEEITTNFMSPDGISYSFQMNMNRCNVSVNGDEFIPLSDQQNDHFSYKRVGRVMTLKTWFGLSLFRDGRTVKINVPAIFMGSVKGLCQNYDQDKCNDWMRSDGTFVENCECDLEGIPKLTQCEKDMDDEWKTDDDPKDPEEPEDPVDPEVKEKCEEVLNEDYLKKCNELIDNSALIKSCAVDYAAVQDNSTLVDIVSNFVDACKKQLPDDDDSLCDWKAASGLEETTGTTCGENQVFKGCAKPCADTMSCIDHIKGKTCHKTEETVSMCVCKEGYYLWEGACWEAGTCRDYLYTGILSPWSQWSECSAACGKGTRTKTRLCAGPGECTPKSKLVSTAKCVGAVCVPPGNTCAVLYDRKPMLYMPSESFSTGEGQVKNLGKLTSNGRTWARAVSYVEVEPDCYFEGFKDTKFKKLLGRWNGGIGQPAGHMMDPVYEDNKMKSYRCSCRQLSCEAHYTHGSDIKLPEDCPVPSCGLVTFDTCDSWKKLTNGIWRHGMAIRIHIPEKYWGVDGWSLIVRFNGAYMHSGNFQLWNANFFNVYRKDTGLEVHIQQKEYAEGHNDDRHSFLLVAERLSGPDMPEFYFWPKRHNNHACFDHVGTDRNSKSTFDRVIELSEEVHNASEVSFISVSKGGMIRVRH